MAREINYSIITPSAGRRPKALAAAISSAVAAFAARAGVDPDFRIEMLVGFDGVRPDPPPAPDWVRWYFLRPENDFGNGVRNALIRASRGRRLLFLDDDNALAPEAFSVWESFPEAELALGRIDVSRAFVPPFLPRPPDDRPRIRPGNVDSLNVCASRELVLVRCGGWVGTGYEADYRNILAWSRRAKSVVFLDDLVGVYDAFADLDPGGRNRLRERRA